MNLNSIWRRLPVVTLFAAGVVLLAGAGQANAQAVITGRVVDADGAPVAFVEIAIERLNIVTVAGADGEYRLLVPAARVTGQREMVVARALGYRSETLEVQLREGEISLDFTLMLDPLKLEGIVATGQALTTTRERLGYTVSTVEAEEIVDSQESNVVSALAGKAPGVWVTSASGDPGGGAYINIRGFNTILTNNEPLFVVDGTPVDNTSFTLEDPREGVAAQNRLADLNPEDIESIEILKGPAASSIYGSAGASGAVLITTKSGRRGVTRFTGKLSYSWDNVNNSIPLQTQYGQGGLVSIASWGDELPAGTSVYDHWGEIFRTGHRATADMSLSGGSDRTTYFLSGSYSNHQGVIVGNSELDRLSVRLKATQWILDNLSVSGNFAYTNQQGDMIQQGSNTSGLLLASLRTPPEFNNCLPNNTLEGTGEPIPCYVNPQSGLHFSYRNPNPTSLTQGRGFDNPFWIANEIPNTTDVGRTFGNVRTDWQAMDWLNVSWILGADYANDERLTLFPKSSSGAPEGRIFRGTYRTFDIDHTLLFTAERTFNENLSGSLTLGQNLRQQEISQIVTTGDNVIFGAEELDFTVDRSPNEFKSTVRTDGYFGEANADLFGQLYLSARVRNEASSTFGPETDSRFWYPSFSAAWTFTRLAAFENVNWLSFGKARVGWGVAGKAPNVYSNIGQFTSTFFNDGWLSTGLETIYLGREGLVSESGLGNSEIKPEKTTEWEAGVDLAFLNSRVSFSGTYYYQKTTDAILNVSLPYSTGYGFIPTNGAEFENKGWEFSLDVVPVQRENFTWELGAQWSKNNSTVLSLLGDIEAVGIGFNFFGRVNNLVLNACGPNVNEPCPFGVILGDDWVKFGRGVDLGDGNIDELYPDAPAGALYIAEDGFPEYDPTERVIGDPNPDWLASIRNTFQIYRNLRVSTLLDIKHGGVMANGTKGALFFYGTHAETLPFHGDGVQNYVFDGYGPGVGTEVTLDENWAGPGGEFNTFNGPNGPFVEDAGYVKLRDVSVTYAFDQEWVNQLGFNTIEVTLSGRNLKTWTDYTGIDPESSLVGQSVNRGQDYFNHPQTRSFILTFNFIR
jgi:TonB-linked SusC/RagA family outer membrane protein